jgi:hypothetical protein
MMFGFLSFPPSPLVPPAFLLLPSFIFSVLLFDPFPSFFLTVFHSLLFATGPIFHFLYGPASLRTVVDGYAVLLSQSPTLYQPRVEYSSFIFDEQ